MLPGIAFEPWLLPGAPKKQRFARLIFVGSVASDGNGIGSITSPPLESVAGNIHFIPVLSNCEQYARKVECLLTRQVKTDGL